MKVTIEMDVTPEEARRALGLPDLTPLHDHYIERVREAVERGTIAPEMIGNLMKSWAPMGEAGMDFWRGLLATAAKPKGQ